MKQLNARLISIYAMVCYTLPVYASRLEDPFKRKLSQGYHALEAIAYVLVGCAIMGTLIQCVLCAVQGKPAPWGRLGVIGAVATAIISVSVIKNFLGVRW